MGTTIKQRQSELLTIKRTDHIAVKSVEEQLLITLNGKSPGATIFPVFVKIPVGEHARDIQMMCTDIFGFAIQPAA